MNTNTAARGLGLFSICIGLAEVAATKSVGQLMRMKGRPGMLRSFGMREIATGVGLLTGKRRDRWVWARVAGDAMDLVALGSAVVHAKRKRARAAAAFAAVAGVTALDIVCGRQLSKAHMSRAQ